MKDIGEKVLGLSKENEELRDKLKDYDSNKKNLDFWRDFAGKINNKLKNFGWRTADSADGIMNAFDNTLSSLERAKSLKDELMIAESKLEAMERPEVIEKRYFEMIDPIIDKRIDKIFDYLGHAYTGSNIWNSERPKYFNYASESIEELREKYGERALIKMKDKGVFEKLESCYQTLKSEFGVTSTAKMSL